jgi:hypothetical protein
MKIFSKHSISIFFSLFVLLLITACSKLDYKNTSVINPDNVWNDKNLINGFLTDIHGSMMPGWTYDNSADEGMGTSGSLSDYMRGIISVEKNGQGLNYTNIDKINYFLSKVPTVSTSVLTDIEKNQMIGQALFWRAWDYWSKVSTVGGVPLILKPQDITNMNLLLVTRNKTSECVTQIIKDLDNAIAVLPDKWDDTNYGRIDKGAAMAFKGRVLLWYASPLFNNTNDQTRWQNAYDANKAAVDYLKAQGKGLYPSYRQIWKQERNNEVIMVNQFYYPDHTFFQGIIRPEPLTKDNSNNDQPILSLLNAYPKKDGSPMQFDIAQLQNPDYNAQYLTDFYMNRDDRFYTTIFCGGTKYPTPDLTGETRDWRVWKKVADASSPSGFKYVSLASDEYPSANFGNTGFFQLKGLDESLTKTLVYNATTDWIEIRYAEVLMNYGECANELGKTDEALQVLYDIRKRASILAGSNNKYGITASSQTEIRDAYINERFVEFAFENKRFGDLRRLKRFDILNNQQYRAGLYVVINDGQTVSWTDDITDPAVRQKFSAVYIENLDGGTQYKYNLSLNHWFYPISKNDLDRNSKLIQNNEWGGTFDPLQ